MSTSIVKQPGYRALLTRELALLTIGAFLLMVVNAFEIIGSAAAMPAVLQDLGGTAFYGWAISAPLLASLVSAPFGGRLADRFGTRMPVALTLGLFALGRAITATAPSMQMVAAGRFIQGLGVGALTTLELVIVARRYPMELRSRMLTLISAAFVLPGLIGPSIAAGIASSFGWRWVYGGIIPVLMITGMLILPALAGRESTDKEPSAFPWWGPLLLAGGIAATVGGLATSQHWFAPIGLIGIVLAVVGGRVTLPSGTWRARPGPDAAIAAALFGSAAYLTYEAFVPLLLVEIRGQSLLRAALPLTAASLCWTSGSWWQARVDPMRRPSLGRLGGVLLTLGLILGSTLLIKAVPFWIAYPATGLAAFGMGLAFTIEQVVAVEWALPGREGELGGFVQLANLLGAAVGTSVSAIAVAWFDTQLTIAIGVTFVFTIMCAIAAAWAGGHLPGGHAPTHPVEAKELPV